MIKISLWITGILFMVIMLGCTGQQTDKLTVAEITSTSAIVVTVTSLSPSATPTFTPTETTTPTPIATATPRATSTPTTTPTPLPLLPATERRAIVDELIQTNGGCQLPCWWGFTPGQTTWTEIEAALSQLTGQILHRPEGRTYTVLYRDLTETRQDYIPSQLYLAEDNVFLALSATISRTTSYHIAEVLNSYQTPNEIWVYSVPDINDGSQAFFLTLFYQKGFMITYPYLHPVIHEPILGCYTQITDLPELLVWSTAEATTFREAARFGWFAKDAIFDWQPLAKATKMDIPTFVETFQDPNNTTCLETEAEFWYDVLDYK